MSRALVGICAALTALCALQWTTLRDLKRDLAQADSHAYRRALLELHDRQDEIARVITWLDATAKDGLCRNDRVDVDSIRTLVLDVYLAARASGTSETAARELVVSAMQGAVRR